MIIGTAGHVDHGKTLLVKRLTGVDTDRLAEEKRRGISIDLGFAYLPGSDGRTLGFVDVPGHERFIKTMVAGVSGIDAVMLVIAANEGIKPQTIEHLQVLDLLGISEGVVALNKIDLVSADALRGTQSEIRDLLRGTKLSGAQIVPVSAHTGAGLDDLRHMLFALASGGERRSGGAFRLAIDRSFSLVGAGTVVTGTVLSGHVSVGDEVLILPQRIEARVRALHAQGNESETAAAGERCALNLTGKAVAKDAIARGDWVLTPTHAGLTERIDTHMVLLPTASRALKDGTGVHLHVGASDVVARAIVLEGPLIKPDGIALTQFALSRALPLRHGDRFVVRDASSQETIGGGSVCDVRPPARHRRDPLRLDLLKLHREPSPAAALQALLDVPPGFVNLTAFAADRMLTARDVEALSEQLSLTLIATGAETYVTTARNSQTLRETLTSTLREHHRKEPAAAGMRIEALRKALDWRQPPGLLREIIAALMREHVLTFAPPWVSLAGHVSQMSPADSKARADILELIEENRSQPPRVPEMAKVLRINEIHVRRLCKALARSGTVVEVAPDRFFLRDAVVEFAVAAKELASHQPGHEFTAATFRDEIKSGRTAAIQMLEFFDRHGLTVRRGDLRKVIKDPLQVFG